LLTSTSACLLGACRQASWACLILPPWCLLTSTSACLLVLAGKHQCLPPWSLLTSTNACLPGACWQAPMPTSLVPPDKVVCSGSVQQALTRFQVLQEETWRSPCANTLILSQTPSTGCLDTLHIYDGPHMALPYSSARVITDIYIFGPDVKRFRRRRVVILPS
jgi:hypothetical protein